MRGMLSDCRTTLAARAGVVIVIGLLTGSCSTLQQTFENLMSSLRPTPEEALEKNFSELRATADRVIVDAGRRETYLAGSHEMEAQIIAFGEYATASVEQFRKAFTDYDVDRDELEGLLVGFHARQSELQSQLVDLHLEMARTVDAGEWAALVKKERKIFKDLYAHGVQVQR